MSWLRKITKFSLIVFALAPLAGCGVKGDPIPPDRPPSLGRGRPTYRGATEGIKIEKHQRQDDEDEDEDKEGEDE